MMESNQTQAEQYMDKLNALNPTELKAFYLNSPFTIARDKFFSEIIFSDQSRLKRNLETGKYEVGEDVNLNTFLPPV